MPTPSRRIVLVVPEGIIEEAKLIFESAAELAKTLPDYKFIFRSHPVLPFECVRSLLSIDVNSIPNIEISESELEVDLNRSSVVLYRGSSVVFYAVLAGLKPYYFHVTGRPYVNPLFQLEGWCESIGNIEQLRNALVNFSCMDDGVAKKEWLLTKTVIENYIRPVDECAISNVVSILQDR